MGAIIMAYHAAIDGRARLAAVLFCAGPGVNMKLEMQPIHHREAKQNAHSIMDSHAMARQNEDNEINQTTEEVKRRGKVPPVGESEQSLGSLSSEAYGLI